MIMKKLIVILLLFTALCKAQTVTESYLMVNTEKAFFISVVPIPSIPSACASSNVSVGSIKIDKALESNYEYRNTTKRDMISGLNILPNTNLGDYVIRDVEARNVTITNGSSSFCRCSIDFDSAYGSVLNTNVWSTWRTPSNCANGIPQKVVRRIINLKVVEPVKFKNVNADGKIYACYNSTVDLNNFVDQPIDCYPSFTKATSPQRDQFNITLTSPFTDFILPSSGIINPSALGLKAGVEYRFSYTKRYDNVGGGVYSTSGRTTTIQTRIIFESDPVVSAGGAQEVCQFAGPISLIGASPSGGTWSGTGVNGSNFDPSTLAPNNYTVTYTATSPKNSCSIGSSKTVTINALPTGTFSFNLPAAGICPTNINIGYVNDSEGNSVETTESIPVNLNNFLNNQTGASTSFSINTNGNPTSLSGPFIYPNNVNSLQETITITATGTNTKGCKISTNGTLRINPKPRYTISNFDDQYCFDSGLKEINEGYVDGNLVSPNNAEWNGFYACKNGIAAPVVTKSNNKWFFDTKIADINILTTSTPPSNSYSCIPSTEAGGVQTFGTWFRAKNSYGCYNDVVYKRFTIKPVPTITTNVTDTIVCKASGTVKLKATPSSGVWSTTPNNAITTFGQQVVFDLTKVSVGIVPVNYSYTNSYTCTKSISRNYKVSDITGSLDFNFPSLGICSNATYNLASVLSNSTGLTPVYNAFLNNVDAGGITGSSFKQTASIVATTFDVRATVTNSDGCKLSVTEALKVNTLPIALIDYSKAKTCKNVSAFELNKLLLSGSATYSGLFVTNVGSVYNLDATKTVSNPHSITVNMTDAITGCTSNTSVNMVINSPPVVTVPSDTTLCVQSFKPLLKTGTPVGGTWTGTGVETLNSKQYFNSNTPSLGVTNLTYSYTDGNGCSNSAVRKFTTSDVVGSFSFSFPSSGICTGQQSNFTTNGWLTNNTSLVPVYSGSFVTNNNYAPINNGTSEILSGITAKVTNLNGCSKSITQSISINPLPVLSIGSNNEIICNYSKKLLNDGSPVGGVWSGSGVTASGSSYEFSAASFTPNSTPSVKYSFTSNKGCTKDITKTFVVKAAPIVKVAKDTSLCYYSKEFQLYGGTPLGGSWSGSNIIKKGNGYYFTPSINSLGVNTVSYSYSDGNGCTSFADMNINLLKNNYDTVFLESKKPYFCLNDSVSIFASVKPTANPIFKWFKESSDTIPVYVGSKYSLLTNKDVIVFCANIDATGCISPKWQYQIPVETIQSNITSNKATVNINESFQLLSNASTFSEKYEWTVGGETSIRKNPSWYFYEPDTLDVNLKITSQNGCVREFKKEKFIIVQGKKLETVTDEKAVIDYGLTSKNNYMVYPNPFENEVSLVVESSVMDMLQIIVYDLMGNQVYAADEKLAAGVSRFKIDKDLASGIYQLRLISKELNESIKLVKSK